MSKKVDNELEIKKMELEMERFRMEREEREKEREAREKEREREEREKEREEREKEREREERKELREMEEREKEREERDKERSFELERLRLQSQSNSSCNNTDEAQQPLHTRPKFSASSEVRLVPPFDEHHVDKYFQHFEKVATGLEWPKNVWPVLLQSVIKGKAQRVYSTMSADDASDYEQVKTNILKAYELIPEAYRQKFRNCRKSEGQTYMEFANEKKNYFDCWCRSEEVKTFEDLQELILLEEFKRCIRDDIKGYLNEKNDKSLQHSARLADEFSLTHKSKFTPTKSNQSQPKFTSGDEINNPKSNENKNQTEHKGQSGTNVPNTENRSGLFCTYCKKNNHKIADCYALKRKKENDALPHGFVINFNRRLNSNDSDNPVRAEKAPLSDNPMKDFLPFVSEGIISQHENSSSSMPIRILRDTGASQSLLLQSTLSLCDENATDFTIIKGIGGKTFSIPLHTVFLQSDYITGNVQVGTIPNLPLKGISLLLGNDLAGGEVLSSRKLTSTPNSDDIKVNSDIVPSCTETRAKAHHQDSIKPLSTGEVISPRRLASTLNSDDVIVNSDIVPSCTETRAKAHHQDSKHLSMGKVISPRKHTLTLKLKADDEPVESDIVPSYAVTRAKAHKQDSKNVSMGEVISSDELTSTQIQDDKPVESNIIVASCAATRAKALKQNTKYLSDDKSQEIIRRTRIKT